MGKGRFEAFSDGVIAVIITESTTDYHDAVTRRRLAAFGTSIRSTLPQSHRRHEPLA